MRFSFRPNRNRCPVCVSLSVLFFRMKTNSLNPQENAFTCCSETSATCTVYRVMTPLLCTGGLQATSTWVGPAVTALMSAGRPGTEMNGKCSKHRTFQRHLGKWKRSPVFVIRQHLRDSKCCDAVFRGLIEKNIV